MATLTETEILDRVRDIIRVEPDRLDMGSWHADEGDEQNECGTTHCLAGWAQVLTKRMDESAEDVGREVLPITCRTIGFFCETKIARAWLESRAYAEETPISAFGAVLVEKLGYEHITDVRHEMRGDAWLDGSATLTNQTGGDAWLYGSATLTNQTGGVARLRSPNAKILHADNCTVIREEWDDDLSEWREVDRKVYPAAAVEGAAS